MTKIPPDILARLNAITAKRSRTVIQHIIRAGSITSQQLTELYGYEHPPRAIRDVRELDIPLITERMKAEDGKTIAVYRFGDLTQWKANVKKTSGRTALTKTLKDALVAKYGAKCSVYLEEMSPVELQVDHRVPYEIGGEASSANVDSFMLLSPSANRMKSWSCEHCANWIRKDPYFCLRCFWAHPENYDHIAGVERREIHLMFSGDEIVDYEKLMQSVGEESAQAYIKRMIHERLT